MLRRRQRLPRLRPPLCRGEGHACAGAGPILDLSGRQLGAHSGLANYTVGQRKGLGIAAREPLHVLQLDSARNAVIIGPAAALERECFTVHQTTWTRDTPPDGPMRVEVKVRYKAQPVRGLVTPLPDGRAEVALEQPIRAVRVGAGRRPCCRRRGGRRGAPQQAGSKSEPLSAITQSLLRALRAVEACKRWLFYARCMAAGRLNAQL